MNDYHIRVLLAVTILMLAIGSFAYYLAYRKEQRELENKKKRKGR